ncbi:MAG: DUF4430 domain-containing protein [Eggerthella sp.]|nr:DUF4430 domain-containing protein [Eggerthella sp.]
MAEDPKKLTRAHKIALGIISAACCCLIGVSAFALAAPDALNQNQSNLEQTAQQADSASGDNTDSAPQEGQSGDAADQGANAQSENTGASSNQGKSTEKGGNTSSGSSNKASSSNNASANKQSGSSGSQGTTTSSSASNTVTVSVSVSSNAADGRVSGSAHPTFKKGATAYDALCATGLSVSTKSSQYGLYVSAIGGLAEFEYGGKSGWMYSVNGSAPNVSCGKYVLKDGDSVSWYYVK